MPKLAVVIASTRPGRVGWPVGQWFLDRARAHGKFEVELVDLKELNLPHLDEPKHPRLQQYEHAHTKAWSDKVKGTDTFVFVTPEYNYGMPPALLNALNYLYVEWNYKAAGLVHYGGISGGTRSAQVTKQTLCALKMVPLTESVTIPFVAQHIDETGNFKGGDPFDKSAATLLDELLRWNGALQTLRT
jgi:NAD(P)H-dependent FMN reductase